MRVLAFGTYDVSSHPRVDVLIRGFRDHGHDVTEINRPLGIGTAERVAMVRQPWRLPMLALRLVRYWTVLTFLGLRARRRIRPDVVLVGYLGHFDVHLARRIFRHTPIILDHLVSAEGTIHDRGLTAGDGPRTWLMRVIDAAAVGASDLILVDTDQRRELLDPSVQMRTAVCPVGATEEWFAAGKAALARTPRGALRLVFVGLYTPLHGTPVLAEALASLAGYDGIEISMVGDGQDRRLAEHIAASNPRVTWADWVSPAELPSFVAHHDVSLGIFGTTAKAGEVVPTKAYQGAAAATVVVTADTAPQRAAFNDAAVFIPPGDSGQLAAAVQRLAEDPAAVSRLRRLAYDHACSRFTARAVVQPVLTALASLRLVDGPERLP